ncbi:probable RNA-binding protein 18 isoform X1 [Drosophila pseudoobscura]|uniref:Probable RNA-binding protein 18 isoform X1 n=1 Tax=Drosophila pseudoobscura pseudoobscura TaxID=46245 RepID=Q29H86_DROPS|nr:probable RNA-binding protein 18 isoform X1 [Drosophila pseudoobscura]
MANAACTSGGGGSAGAGEGATAAASAGAGEEQRRIWVGNLDSRITEFQLLKLMQKCGPIEKFDMLFHKGGPMVGQSRGYAFVTFAENEGATNALLKLDGTSVGSRSIAVRLAKNIKYDDLQKPKPRIEIPALGTGKREEKISKSEAIRAIEAKLKHLERHTDDNLELNPREGFNANVPFIQRYQFNKDRDNTQRYGKSSAPYHRQQRPKRR